jgi:hypothetical protein
MSDKLRNKQIFSKRLQGNEFSSNSKVTQSSKNSCCKYSNRKFEDVLASFLVQSLYFDEIGNKKSILRIAEAISKIKE